MPFPEILLFLFTLPLKKSNFSPSSTNLIGLDNSIKQSFSFDSKLDDWLVIRLSFADASWNLGLYSSNNSFTFGKENKILSNSSKVIGSIVIN